MPWAYSSPLFNNLHKVIKVVIKWLKFYTLLLCSRQLRGALPLDPIGGMPSPDPQILLLPEKKFVATPLRRRAQGPAEVDTE